MIYLGIDPGVCGGMAALLSDGTVLKTEKFKDATEADIAEFFKRLSLMAFALIERVSSSPQMGVVSAFTFGRSYGFLRGLLIAHGIAFEEVSPVKWQNAMGCRTGGDKNISKARAQQLFPGVKITHANADALRERDAEWQVKHDALLAEVERLRGEVSRLENHIRACENAGRV